MNAPDLNLDFSAFTPLDFARPDSAGAVVGDPSSDVVTIHVRRPVDQIFGVRDVWLSFQTDDAADMASRILDVAGGNPRRNGLIAVAMAAFSGAFVGSVITFLYIGAFQP